MSTFQKSNTSCLDEFDKDVLQMWQQLLDRQFPLDDKIVFLSSEVSLSEASFEVKYEQQFGEVFTEEVFDPDFGLEATVKEDGVFYEEGEVPVEVSTDECHKHLVKMHSILIAFSKGEDIVPMLLAVKQELDTEALQLFIMDLMSEWELNVYN